MFKENENQKAFTLLSEVALCISDTQQIAAIGDQKESLAILERAFLVGHFADDTSTRNSVLVVVDQLKEWYNLLEKHTPDDVKDALQLLHNFHHNV